MLRNKKLAAIVAGLLAVMMAIAFATTASAGGDHDGHNKCEPHEMEYIHHGKKKCKPAPTTTTTEQETTTTTEAPTTTTTEAPATTTTTMAPPPSTTIPPPDEPCLDDEQWSDATQRCEALSPPTTVDIQHPTTTVQPTPPRARQPQRPAAPPAQPVTAQPSFTG